MKKAALLILDGWGIGKIQATDAIAQAKTPIMDDLLASNPNAQLTTFGQDVGLPAGQMGNSEVGHMNIGAGRIVYQDLLKINRDITSRAFFDHPVLTKLMQNCTTSGKKLHLIGLLSDGGVHSHINHLLALVELSDQFDLSRTYVHAFLDGRDTDPNGGKEYIKTLTERLDSSSVALASVIGRYYAMDRDTRWNRTKKAYDLMVHGIGEQSEDVSATVQNRYDEGQTDEFIEPIILDSQGLIKDGDTVLFFNFRSDRPRQLTTMLSIKDFAEQETKALNLDFYTMTPYDETFVNVEVIYDKAPLEQTFGHLLEKHGLTQLRMAETEKYPHVTYFFSGGHEEAFKGESRIMVNSPKVATYDLQPEMSAQELTQALLDRLKTDQPNFICLNFANTDMVGHTGDFDAVMKAAETVDGCVGQLVDELRAKDYEIIIIADHGNADMMINEDGSPNTAHSVNPVPIIYVGSKANQVKLNTGNLADVAPTLAGLLEIEVFEVMEGKNLISQ